VPVLVPLRVLVVVLPLELNNVNDRHVSGM